MTATVSNPRNQRASLIDEPWSNQDWLVGAEATLLAADPPRASALALWSATGGLPGADDEVTLILPAGTSVLRRDVSARIVPLAELLDPLLSLPAAAPVGASIRAWSVAARLALELIARGRLTPGITALGNDGWQLGPLDPDDAARLASLADALPPEAHCLPVGSDPPLRMVSPAAAVRSFGDAVADLLVRTSAAPLVAGHDAFAATEPERVDGSLAWFAAINPAGGRTTITLRLEPPTEPADAFEADLILQSPDDPSLWVPATDLWTAPEAVMSRFEGAEETLLLTLRRAARIWPPLGRLLQEASPTRLVLDDAECDELLGPIVDDLASAGLWVQWPADLLKPLHVRPAITTPSPDSALASGLSLDVILEWKASVDGVDLNHEELDQLASAKRGVVRLRGQWVRVDAGSLARLDERRQLDAGAALGVALGGSLVLDGESVEAEVIGPLATLGTRLRDLDLGRDQSEPAGLAAELRPYQRRGLAWLSEMAALGLGGILADDMGLGKTIQLLALHLHLHTDPTAASDADPAAGAGAGPRKPTLVVCPATLLANWEREAARFAPGVPVRRFHGRARSLDGLAANEIVVTTYGVARRDVEAVAAVEWGIVAADEAQAVKNPLSRSARTLRQINADARFALTGTPVENQLSELWAIADWTTPGLLGPLERFRREVAIPIERDLDPEASAWLATLVRPFVLRRRKTDPGIAPDLPPKTETDRVVPLTVEQTTLYQAVVDESLDKIEEVEGIHRRGLVLKLLTELKQICNHPAQFLGQPGPLVGRSGKLEALTDLLAIIADEGASTLVFTQYVSMGRLLEDRLGALGHSVSFLHGSLGLTRRQELVDRFQDGEPSVFILSLKAGGTGLNLTRASHVVHYDRWWNPAVEDQASDRAWRIGQDKPVQIHRLVCEGTVEDRIAALLATKRQLADQVVAGGEAWVSELDDAELTALVSLSSRGGGA